VTPNERIGAWLGALVILALFFLNFVLWPMALIWSLNTLFPSAHVPYAFETWLAACVLVAITRPRLPGKDK
jgi:hypothetical protein